MSGVLVSGATTPLGVRVVHRLVEADRGPVLAVGIEAGSEVRSLFPTGVHYHQTDLTRGRGVRRLLFGPVTQLGLGAVIHLACHRSALDETPRAYRLNVEATRLLLRLAEEHPTLERFVHRSTNAVYLNRSDQADLLREDTRLNLALDAPQWVRDRVEADVTVCARMGLAPVHINVLRCAEILAPDMGSQLYDYVRSRVCLRPLGFDPMIEVLSIEDASRALVLALDATEQGAVNVPGADRLPLSEAVRRWGRDDIPVPGPLLGPLYRMRSLVRRTEFRYDLNRWRMHFNALMDGTRAREILGYVPEHPIDWPYRARGG